ncbi:Uncharacterized protein OBRU01_10766 [Operophtera brumata]|uniref:Uncharacterized protein n=1 Tax=Operophtera brumata TaxID=104452 RepID=A0A0L7LCV5_OPEBR|nr:Uncharacterized protein OBRU01_10766 [Operophtera brumata]
MQRARASVRLAAGLTERLPGVHAQRLVKKQRHETYFSVSRKHSPAVDGRIDRPITQQGISGARNGTARGFRTRQLQDKRYWEELMQVKVREMKAEIARLSEKADAGERERSAKKHYEKRERSTITSFLAEMTQEQKAQYNDLEATAAVLRADAEQARSQLDHLHREKDELATVEEKRDNIKNEMNNRLDPGEEREKLLLQVREDNAAIASLDSNAASLKEQIKNVQKYRELKKREETMDAFMSTYEDNLKKEQERIGNLEKDIVFALEHSSSNIDLDLSEIDSLKQKEGYTTAYDDNKKQRLATELQALPEKTRVMNKELVTLSDLEKLREDDQLAQIEARKTVLEEDIASITLKADYEPLKKQAMEELEALNKKIIEDLNSVKSY